MLSSSLKDCKFFIYSGVLSSRIGILENWAWWMRFPFFRKQSRAISGVLKDTFNGFGLFIIFVPIRATDPESTTRELSWFILGHL
jgi:hypothetical protein